MKTDESTSTFSLSISFNIIIVIAFMSLASLIQANSSLSKLKASTKTNSKVS